MAGLSTILRLDKVAWPLVPPVLPRRNGTLRTRLEADAVEVGCLCLSVTVLGCG